MKGVRFYEELENKNRKGEHSKGNVIAIDVETELISTQGRYEAMAAVFFEPNSEVCATMVARGYLWKCCRRISEARAREIHPRLFERLDT